MASYVLTFCLLFCVFFAARAEISGDFDFENVWEINGNGGKQNQVVRQTDELKQCFAKITTTITELENQNSCKSEEIQKIVKSYESRVKTLENQIITLTKDKQSLEDRVQKFTAEGTVFNTEKRALEKKLKDVTAENLKITQVKINLETNVRKLQESLSKVEKKVNIQINEIKSCNKIRENDKNLCNTNVKNLKENLLQLENNVNLQYAKVKSCNTILENDRNTCKANAKKADEYKAKLEIEITTLKTSLEISESLRRASISKDKPLAEQPIKCQPKPVIPSKNQPFTMTPTTPLEKQLTTLSTGKYYFSINKKLNWKSAQQFCKDNKMELLSIESSKENDEIINQIKKLGLIKTIPKDEIWTSGSDAGNEGHWYWTSTNRSFGFKAWLPGEPNNHFKNQHCSAIAMQKGGINWDDFYCNAVNRFICEMPSYIKG